MSSSASFSGDLTTVGSSQIITCEEQSPVDIALSDVLNPDGTLRLNPEIESGDYFSVSLKKGVLTLRSRAFIGFVPLNDSAVVYIRPRTRPANLTRIVEISGQPAQLLSAIRGYATGGVWRDSLLDLYAETLLRHTQTIEQSGLWREYERRQERSSFPHGRILMHPTIQRFKCRGIDHAAEVSWYERSADTPANRCLKYALWLVAQKYIAAAPKERTQRKIWRRVNAAYALFDDALLDHGQRFLDDPVVRGARPLPSLRGYYREALDLAVAIVEERAVLLDGEGNDVALPSMVFDMDAVFEAYVRNVLGRAAAARSWGVTVHDGMDASGRLPLFDPPTSRNATPDVVIRADDDTFLLVGEVKNQPDRADVKRDAINQAVTYALRYGTGKVVLFTPCLANQPSQLRKLGKVADVAVYHYRVDLSGEDLVAEEAKLAQAIEELI